jgi:dGTPase
LNGSNEFFQENPICPDIVECAGLAHDLGHPPFGHNGEAALDFCMKKFGGFEGNAQTFHILTKTEKKEIRTGFPRPLSLTGQDERLGLNWSYRSLAAIVKYDRVIPISRKKTAPLVKGIYDCDKDVFLRVREAIAPGCAPEGLKTIEAALMDVADDIAYSTYDLEDTFKVGFLTPIDILGSDEVLLGAVASRVATDLGRKFTAEDVLSTLLSVFEQLSADVSSSEPITLEAAIATSRAASRLATDGYLRTKFTADLVSEFIAGVEVEVDECHPKLSKVSLKDETAVKVSCLKHYTYCATIMSPRLRISERRGFDIVRRLFRELDDEDGYLLMPEDFRALYEGCSDELARKRVICDFIAGMTDRYAVEFYGRIFSENPQSIFKAF